MRNILGIGASLAGLVSSLAAVALVIDFGWEHSEGLAAVMKALGNPAVPAENIELGEAMIATGAGVGGVFLSAIGRRLLR